MKYALLRILKPDTSPYANWIQSHMEITLMPSEKIPAEAISIGIGIHKTEEFVMGSAREVERYIHGVKLMEKHEQHWAYEDGKKALNETGIT